MDELARVIRDMFFGGQLHINEQTMITNVRHKECVEDAVSSLKLVLSAVEDGMPEDFFTVDLIPHGCLRGSRKNTWGAGGG